MPGERPPEEIWKVLEEQAREDEGFEREMKAVAAMSDAELDAELRRFGIDPGEAEKRAGEVYPPAVAARAGKRTAAATPNAAQRRRPRVLWLARAAAAAAAAGG